MAILVISVCYLCIVVPMIALFGAMLGRDDLAAAVAMFIAMVCVASSFAMFVAALS